MRNLQTARNETTRALRVAIRHQQCGPRNTHSGIGWLLALQDMNTMLQTNVAGVALFTRLFAPGEEARHHCESCFTSTAC